MNWLSPPLTYTHTHPLARSCEFSHQLFLLFVFGSECVCVVANAITLGASFHCFCFHFVACVILIVTSWSNSPQIDNKCRHLSKWLTPPPLPLPFCLSFSGSGNSSQIAVKCNLIGLKSKNVGSMCIVQQQSED